MSLEDNKNIVRRILTGFWQGGDAAVLDELLAPDIRNHDLSREPIRGREACKAWAQGFRQAAGTGFPDLTITLDDLIAEDDRVAKRWTIRGTHRGDYLGVPPTGRPVTMVGITIYRIENGRVQETWWTYDALGLMQQIGAIPVPERAGAT